MKWTSKQDEEFGRLARAIYEKTITDDMRRQAYEQAYEAVTREGKVMHIATCLLTLLMGILIGFTLANMIAAGVI